MRLLSCLTANHFAGAPLLHTTLDRRVNRGKLTQMARVFASQLPHVAMALGGAQAVGTSKSSKKTPFGHAFRSCGQPQVGSNRLDSVDFRQLVATY